MATPIYVNFAKSVEFSKVIFGKFDFMVSQIFLAKKPNHFYF